METSSRALTISRQDRDELPDRPDRRALLAMHKADVTLTLTAFGALAPVFGPTTALILAAFLAGLLVGQADHGPPDAR